jgi:ABC-type Fe3+ transport system substrate-binding protein
MLSPDIGISGNIVVTGIIKSTSHPNASKAFMDYFMSAEGQAAFGEVQGLFSARADVPLKNVPPLAEFNPIIVTTGFDDYGSDANRKKFTEVWNKVTGVA